MGPGGPFRAAGCALLVPVPSSPFEPFKILLLRHRPRPLRLQPRRGWSSRHICSHAARRVQYTVQPDSVICVVRFRALVAAHNIAESVRQPAGRRGATRQLPLVAHDRATSERPRLSELGDSAVGDSVHNPFDLVLCWLDGPVLYQNSVVKLTHEAIWGAKNNISRDLYFLPLNLLVCPMEEESMREPLFLFTAQHGKSPSRLGVPQLRRGKMLDSGQGPRPRTTAAASGTVRRRWGPRLGLACTTAC